MKIKLLITSIFLMFSQFSLGDELIAPPDGEGREEVYRKEITVMNVACGYNDIGLPNNADMYEIYWKIHISKGGVEVDVRYETTTEFIKCSDL